MTIRSLLRVLDYEKMRVLKKKIFHVEKNVKQKGKAPGFTRTIGYNRVPSIKIKKTVWYYQNMNVLIVKVIKIHEKEVFK